MDPQFLLVIVFAMVTAIVYSIWNYITKTDPGSFELKRLLASTVFGIFLGVVTIYTVADSGMQIEQINFDFLAGLFVTYSGLLIYINRGMDWLWQKIYGQKLGQAPKYLTDRVDPLRPRG